MFVTIIFHRRTRNNPPHHDFLTNYATLLFTRTSPCANCHKLSHRRRCLYAICHIISYVLFQPLWFHTNVSTTKRVHVRVRALKDGRVHIFLTYEDMPMRNV